MTALALAPSPRTLCLAGLLCATLAGGVARATPCAETSAPGAWKTPIQGVIQALVASRDAPMSGLPPRVARVVEAMREVTKLWPPSLDNATVRKGKLAAVVTVRGLKGGRRALFVFELVERKGCWTWGGRRSRVLLSQCSAESVPACVDGRLAALPNTSLDRRQAGYGAVDRALDRRRKKKAAERSPFGMVGGGLTTSSLSPVILDDALRTRGAPELRARGCLGSCRNQVGDDTLGKVTLRHRRGRWREVRPAKQQKETTKKR